MSSGISNLLDSKDFLISDIRMYSNASSLKLSTLTEAKRSKSHTFPCHSSCSALQLALKVLSAQDKQKVGILGMLLLLSSIVVCQRLMIRFCLANNALLNALLSQDGQVALFSVFFVFALSVFLPH